MNNFEFFENYIEKCQILFVHLWYVSKVNRLSGNRPDPLSSDCMTYPIINIRKRYILNER